MAKAYPGGMTILLMDGGPSDRFVRAWLTKNGFVVWRANDLSHAIEELSDFTVRSRPDLVLLDVPVMPECFETFRDMVRLSSDNLDVTVIGLSENRKGSDHAPLVARNLYELSAVLNKEAGLHARAA